MLSRSLERGRPAAAGAPAPRAVGVWLLLLAALVAATVLLGGATRLTDSGLSIVEWRPVTGVVPPLDDAAWQAAFAEYRAFPEYRKVNRGMSLAEFKRIYWFEYTHRLLGRLIGAAFLVPALWFLWRRQLDGRLGWRLAAIFALGALQGAIGWWMVRSGLIDRPDVSQYRLAVHFGLALVILGLLLRLGWRIVWPAPAVSGGWAWAVLALIFLQMLSGALLAGLDGGLHYNTFPSMNGYWLPPELWAERPWWLNLLENPTTAQFDHRLGAYLVVAAVLALAWRRGRRQAVLLVAALALQFSLGVATLLWQVPVALGVLHQGGALALFAAVLWAADRGRSPAAVG